MKNFIFASVISLGLALGGVAGAQTPGSEDGAASKEPTKSPSAASSAHPRSVGAKATPTTNSGAPEPHDRRLKALQGAASDALPNVDAAAAANQVQIPDYPPVDRDKAPPSKASQPPR
jgi:hypothetical protein